jgi:hypothetical protein
MNRIGEQKNALNALVELLETSDKEKAATIVGRHEGIAHCSSVCNSTYTPSKSP